MDIFWAIDRKPTGNILEIVGFFIKNRQDKKNDLTRSQELFN